MDAIESDLDEALADIKGIAKKLRVMQDVFSGGVMIENEMKQTLKDYKTRFEELEKAWCNDLMQKNTLVDEKGARLSKQLTMAVAVSIEELVKRGKLVCLEEVLSKDLSTDPLFQAIVEQAVLKQLIQHKKLFKSVEKKCVEIVDETLEAIFK